MEIVKRGGGKGKNPHFLYNFYNGKMSKNIPKTSIA